MEEAAQEEFQIEIIEEQPLVLVPRLLPFLDEIPRRIVQVGEFRRGQPLIFVRDRALVLMESHTRSVLDHEVGGLVVGNFCMHGDLPFTWIDHVIPALHARSSSGNVMFTPETILEMDECREKEYPHMRFVGWYHSHPGFGIFLSPTDLHSHTTVFANGPFVAIVLDPIAKTNGIFAWIHSKVAGPLGYWITHV